jgi:hypothetical protein
MSISTGNRRSVTIVLLIVVALLVSTMVASAAATAKQLSTNYTLVNLASSSNSANIRFYTPTGTQWRTPKNVTLPAQGDQFIDRQYFDADLPGGAGSVVVGGTGELGAVVQIQARNQVPTSGAYVGASAGSTEIKFPLVAKNVNSASGVLNSQVIVQNTGTGVVNAEIALIDAAGATKRTIPVNNLAVGAAFTYDVTTDASLDKGQYSAVVKATTAGGSVTAVSNLFMGPDGLQTYGGFSNGATKWVAPLFTSRLGNGLSTVFNIQNVSGGTIPAGGIQLACKPDPGSSSQATLAASNPDPVTNTASYQFNPVVDTTRFPTKWQGACTVTTSASTVAFVQMRFVGTGNVAAYEAIRGDGTKTKIIVPLYMKRLGNGFSTVTTIANLGTAPATVTIQYKRSAELDPAITGCYATLTNLAIPVGASIIQNLRITSGQNSVPEIGNRCQGSMVITSNGQPVDAFVQITDIDATSGDTFMAHDAFTVTN